MPSPGDPLSQIEQALEDLTRRWERYFANDPKVPTPPDRDRAELERRLRNLSRIESPRAAEAFRLEQLLHRFATFNALWQRQLRQREEARTTAAARAAAPATPPAAAAVAAEPNARPAPSVRASEGYGELYERYAAALGRGAASSVGLEKFSQALEAQRRKLEQGGAVVEGFDVVTEGGQVRLKARLRRGRNG